ncbi:MAG: hypothetical protein LBB59_02725 [Campylobacteraceae bacterium]|nr:hypothetical protein [Campylobacteraceae bacterium]
MSLEANIAYIQSRQKGVSDAVKQAHADINEYKNRFKSDTPNQYLKDLQEKIFKAKDHAKRAELQADFDKKLVGSRSHIKSMIEAKEKRIKEMNQQLTELDGEIKKLGKDLEGVKERLNEFESENVNEKGEIITDFEELC